MRSSLVSFHGESRRKFEDKFISSKTYHCIIKFQTDAELSAHLQVFSKKSAFSLIGSASILESVHKSNVLLSIKLIIDQQIKALILFVGVDKFETIRVVVISRNLLL